MEVLKKEIEKFLKIDGYGSGYGYGYGYSDGDGDGSGYGYGPGDGYSDGSGYGYGYGDGYSDGSGYSDGDGIKSINGYLIYKIDDTPTIIYSIHSNVIRGAIVMNDLSMKKCYVVKGQNKFAHGKTIKEAMQSLQEKIFEDIDTDQAIEEFKKHFANSNKKYKASEFYTWHHILTGSCEMGRKAFAQNHGIDLSKDKFTIKEFIDLTKNDYGGSIIKELERRVKWKKKLL